VIVRQARLLFINIQNQPQVPLMRKHHVIAVAAVVVIGLGVKQFFFPAVKAEADTPVASMNVEQILIDHPNRNKFPEQKMHDMTFVFSQPD
jgi:hypothetical protein